MKAWPQVSLGELIRLERRPVEIIADREYQEIGTYSYGRGIFHKTPRSGLEVGNKDLFLMKEGDLILQITFAWEGAIALCSKEEEGLYGSVRYPTFRVDESRCFPPFLVTYLCTRQGLEQIGRICPGSAGRNRVLAIKRLPEILIPLPSLDEQHRIVARLETLAEKTGEVETHLDAVERDADHLLALRFRDAIADAPLRAMAEVAPLIRREQSITLECSYPELGIRSFGKGTFHKPPLSGADVGAKRLYRIEAGDLLFSNVFAWEGAIAIAQLEDAGRFGSHRFITCRTDLAKTSVEFLRYYFLTDEGMLKIGEASPGGAGRNRTLGLQKLMAIEVPVPPLATQQAFDSLRAEVAALKARHTAMREANAAVLPAIVERVFSPAAHTGESAVSPWSQR